MKQFTFFAFLHSLLQASVSEAAHYSLHQQKKSKICRMSDRKHAQLVDILLSGITMTSVKIARGKTSDRVPVALHLDSAKICY